MSVCESVAIVGLGLIGGSLARDLASKGVRVRAYDADAEELAAAVRDGVVHERLDASPSTRRARGSSPTLVARKRGSLPPRATSD